MHSFVCQLSPKYPNCHISASIHPFDPISSPFLIWMSLKYFYGMKMALGWIVLAEFWPFCTVLFVDCPPNTQTAMSRLLFIRLTPSLHHFSFVRALQVFLFIVNGSGLACFGCILALLQCFVCQSYTKFCIHAAMSHGHHINECWMIVVTYYFSFWISQEQK